MTTTIEIDQQTAETLRTIRDNNADVDTLGDAVDKIAREYDHDTESEPKRTQCGGIPD